MSALKDYILEAMDQAEWRLLRSHAEAGRAVLINPELDLAEVGRMFAEDDKDTVEFYIGRQMIRRPSTNDIVQLNQDPDQIYTYLIVHPFVLVQRRILN